jgi:hypothetical protein
MDRELGIVKAQKTDRVRLAKTPVSMVPVYQAWTICLVHQLVLRVKVNKVVRFLNFFG